MSQQRSSTPTTPPPSSTAIDNPTSRNSSDVNLNILPSFRVPGGRVQIRTQTDNDSSSEATSDADVWTVGPLPDIVEGELETAEHLLVHQEYMKRQVEPATPWVLVPNIRDVTNEAIVIIKKPTASKMKHHLLHPALFRHIQGLETLDDFAQMVGAPLDWKEQYERALEDRGGPVQRAVRRFRGLLENAPETEVQNGFSEIVMKMDVALQLGELVLNSDTKVVVGGILAYSQYDLRSQTDVNFLNDDGLRVLATEVNTMKTFSEEEMWHKESRGSLSNASC